MTYEDKIKSIAQEVESIFAYDGEVDPDLVIDIFYEKLLDNVELKMSYEKQMPKKPYNVNEDYLTFDCPTCLSALYSEDKLEYTSYCCKCGQALDWSDEE